ncbi:hypothetical protein L1887_44521 [Cichorium endivia]|nr:hypothetical protein L1887_44521 [Cichorium endivia]
MIDILRPAPSKARPSPQRPASPTLSPASSNSTLKASSSSRTKPDPASISASAARSKGQQARRLSIETAVTSSHRYRYDRVRQPDQPLDLDQPPFRRSTFASLPSHHAKAARATAKDARSRDASLIAPSTPELRSSQRSSSSSSRKRSRPQKPLLGGLYFSDLIVVAFFYAVNLLRTCGIAELVDVAFKAFAYVCTRLPFDFYQRWSLSRPPSTQFASWTPLTNHPPPPNHRLRRELDDRSTPASTTAVTTSSDEESSSLEAFDQDDAQLSPFHHLVLLLVRFACTSFPHLVPRVLFAEETIGPLVRWRTGGGAAGIVREFTSDHTPTDRSPTNAETSTIQDPPKVHSKAKSKPHQTHTYARPGFRAFWIGADAHVPVEVRRSDPSSRSATTFLYLHGGGFSLGSVAFYAEALIRIITKVCSLEERDNDARCVAVEYDLGPTSRFPGPLLQCLRCYAHLIEVEGIDPASITIAGDSAGGNLAMALLLCLDGQARNEPGLAERDWSSLPMPGKAVLISPWADLRPSSSLAFASLREAAAADARSAAPAASAAAAPRHKSTSSRVQQESAASGRVSAWTEAIGQHEWDYVAAEALMHFAQLYAGVLKTPRRVRGPMGWVANVCAVLAGDDEVVPESKTSNKKGAAASAAASIGATAPLAILRTLLVPSQRIARVAHTMLTEPLLHRTSTTRSSASSSDAFNQVEHIRPSAIGALDPIFPASERKTDPVPSTADLFVPLWNEQDEDKGQGKEHRQHDPEFEAARTLLESSKLVNPAIGDWSRIRLKRGMLVLWGDRERLADDIEAWIDTVRQAQVTRRTRDDRPSQDLDPSHADTAEGKHSYTDAPRRTLQERRAASRSPRRLAEEVREHAADWVCTAVEHGPGGVHAWPFVSMYLAGSDAEREKGLEIIARFVADPMLSPASTHPGTPASTVGSLAVELPVAQEHRPLSVAVNSPPHLNAVSPAGSMPSDISSRGDEYDYPFAPSSYTGSEGWDPSEQNELGLEGVYPHETVWTEPTPTPSTGAATPASSDDEAASIGHDELAHRIGLGLAEEARYRAEGSTRMEPVHLHHPMQGRTASWQQASSVQAAPAPAASRSQRDTGSRRGQPAVLGGPVAGRSLAELEADSDRSAPPSAPSSRPESPGWRSESVGYDSHDDDLGAASPPELDADSYFGARFSYADDVIPMDPGFYGLSHYHTLRPEGLSDIAEEESQMDTSSVLSGGLGAGALSPGFSDPSFSPADGASPVVAAANPGRYGAAYTPSASEMARLREALDERERQYRQRFARKFGSPSAGQEQRGEMLRGRFAIEGDDAGSIVDESDGDVDSLDMNAQQAAEASGASAWRSSADLRDLAPTTKGEVARQGEAGPTTSGVAASGSSLLDEGTERAPSPSPSLSSQNSGARDVWW